MPKIAGRKWLNACPQPKRNCTLPCAGDASAFVRRLRQSVERLRMFPYSGRVMPELRREDIRELLRGNYRIIYRLAEHRVEILTVYHSARLLDESDF